MPDDSLSKLKIDKTQYVHRGKSGRKRLYFIIAVLAVVLTIILSVSGLFSPAIKVRTATIVKVYPSQTFTLLNASGYVVPQRQSSIAAKTTGRLVSLYVEEGHKVKKNQIIAQLENADLEASQRQAKANLDVSRAALEQARAELNDAERSFDRQKQLLAKGLIARSDYDTTDARYRKAIAAVKSAESSIHASQAALNQADVSLEYTRIRAPFDAVVLTKNADVGDIVTPLGAAANAKSAVVTIADMSSLQVEADVSESSIGQLKVGQPCEIQLDAIPDTRFRGTIYMIVPTADRSKATVMVKIRFNTIDNRILPEMSAKVAFLSREIARDEEQPRTAVSASALVDRNGSIHVFVVKGNRTQFKQVKTGSRMGDMTEITSGAAAGDKVVLDPPKNLKDNSRIKTVEQ